MGPPSRYALLASATPSAATSKPPVQETFVNTSSMTNTEWAKHHLTQLATARTPEEFSARSKRMLSKSVNITVNGTHLSFALFAQQWGASFDLDGSISISGTVEAPTALIPMVQNAALVGLLYEATFTNAVGSDDPIRISVASSINLTIGEDKTLPSTVSDRRRIVSLNQILIDKDGALTFPLRNRYD